jgi:hypothetical protein
VPARDLTSIAAAAAAPTPDRLDVVFDTLAPGSITYAPANAAGTGPVDSHRRASVHGAADVHAADRRGKNGATMSDGIIPTAGTLKMANRRHERCAIPVKPMVK